MGELRQIELIVERYEIAFNDVPELIKEDLEIFQEDVEKRIAFLDVFLKSSQKDVKKWKKISNETFLIMEINPFCIMKKAFLFRFANWYIDKCTKEMEKAQDLRKRLGFIKKRMEQFHYFS